MIEHQVTSGLVHYCWHILMSLIWIPSISGLASPCIPTPPSISVPVWSLAAPIGECTSMNIVTFATPVSAAQPKLWAVSLYTGTMARDAFFSSKVGVLQLLTPSQKHLVPVLGKRSGYEKDFPKKEECRSIGYDWLKGGRGSGTADGRGSTRILLFDSESLLERETELLPSCAAYVKLEMISKYDAGDHEVALCRVTGTGAWDGENVCFCSDDSPATAIDSLTALYTGQLRREGII